MLSTVTKRAKNTEIVGMRDNAISKDIEYASQKFQNALAEFKLSPIV